MRKIIVVIFFFCISSISIPVFSSEMQDYGKLWAALGREGQFAYVSGYIDGGGYAMRTVMDEIITSYKRGDKIPESFYENIRVKTATLYDEDKIVDVISNLYKDPSNSYILFEDMVRIARDSLSGKDITKLILKARKYAIDTYELNKKIGIELSKIGAALGHSSLASTQRYASLDVLQLCDIVDGSDSNIINISSRLSN